jgi:hypothetical protein
VDIDPAQLVVVHFLLRYKAAPEFKLYDEVSGTLGLDHESIVLSLADLASKGCSIHGSSPMTPKPGSSSARSASACAARSAHVPQQPGCLRLRLRRSGVYDLRMVDEILLDSWFHWH